MPAVTLLSLPQSSIEIRMTLTRRQFSLSLLAFPLAACTTTGTGGASPSDPAFRPTPNAGYDRWVVAYRSRAAARGISEVTLDAAFQGAGYLPGVIERDRNQTEFTRTLEDYLAIAASDERVAKGRQEYARRAALLDRLESRYGVPPEILVAIWGLESRYGERRGDIPVISAVSTLAYDGRRGDFFEQQLTAALLILQNGDVTADGMTGSWAGAMGHTQFIPTSYEAYAVDFNGDGRRDIWSEDPTDALASAAAYLQRSGWQRGQPWVVEALPGSSGGTVIQPQNPGPRFRVYPNFEVIKRYNNSTSYALGVGYLANLIAGGQPLQTGFGPDRYGLTIDDRKALQTGLNRAGYDVGTADGVIGSRTIAAIESYQRANGLAVTGEPSQALLERLR
jgi:membrane-bound lytic murein transglycosylase B